ncbi:GNAT family N-acetyltransferase [Neorhizobium sp. P12A]|uniref:GNAT family N-acetyltransferase n=1 Tax=Neorhizobium sp. P12A TaxID=2268027 RepID=UPI0011EDE517|nr:GNAT family N-acetyltransferase [Neorhizobium sp. P12A]KAA0700320.1 GNAT family N-acetyltransferase [Neorhizobium sp. P12A]
MNEIADQSDISKPARQPGLLIRAAQPTDAEGIAAIANLPGYRTGTLRLPHQTIQETRSWLEKREPGSPNLVALIDGVIVGNAGLRRFVDRRQHVASLGMGVHDDFTGRGIGSALLGELVEIADNWLNIRRIELTVFIDNASAIALYRKFGFIEEGVLKDYAFRAGRFADVYAMARIST